MNTLGLSLMLKMGCICGKESINIDNRNFYIRSRLGEGGFSYVDLIEEAQSHKLFALKRITCHSKDDERVAMQEVEIMGTFHHNNIVPLEAHCMKPVGHYTKTLDITSEVFIVMPYYRRGGLQDKMEFLTAKSEKMAEDKLWRMFLGICHGVRALHSFNPPYAHRDLKPANIMIADDETPVLMDLGSAAKARVDVRNLREARALQDTAEERCSMLYRAPELFNVDSNANIDERTDIWSLGCVLYAMAFLESPFEKAYQRGDSIALASLGRNVKFPENSSFSKSVEDMILYLMTVNVMERPFIDQVISRVDSVTQASENRV
ncbi:serine/threonine-protein kinase 16-like isoform X39 [Haliotis rufescens]|uniref:serine/threonine-protein kinase 16-like isoform X39 n=1 Tax=Haliotis rufescens TaxID=6454 RepID=UPI00201EDD4A|nr:serine/threonine-protein kinase 16-like isoform X39 [Haliotis rufescens]XP_048237233.1 serine/threonine-protein kinase 16-like isoform X39 [Haliotis rufescens]XP_048237235.1 serine/threonine-protein kinase 16-like isoform X39 [Haliotis rufescens]